MKKSFLSNKTLTLKEFVRKGNGDLLEVKKKEEKIIDENKISK